MKILRKKTAKEKEVSFEVDFERRRISGRFSLLFGDQIACVACVERGRGNLGARSSLARGLAHYFPSHSVSNRKYVRPPKQTLVLWALSRVHNVSGGWGGGVLQKWYTGRLHPEIRPLNCPFIYRFDKKVPPFVYLLLINDTPFTHQV